MAYAITVESIRQPSPGARVLIWIGQVQSSGKFQGRVFSVTEARSACRAVYAAVQDAKIGNHSIAVLTEESTLDYPDEISITDACEAYFGSRHKELVWTL
jgi:hypothetical protein